MPVVLSKPELLIGTWSKDRLFRSFMLKFSKDFKSDDVNEIKYALKDKIPAGRMEGLKAPLDIFNELEERNIIGSGNLQELRNLLEDIDRPHLIAKVDEFDDSYSRFPLKPKSENYLELDGYRLAIKGGRHFETSDGEFVEVQSGANYALTIENLNGHRCVLNVKIDGYEMFPIGFLLNPKDECTIERPSREKKMFKCFAVTDAPEGSGINKWRRDQNGVVEVTFTPEKADMKITCSAKGAQTQVLTCSEVITDSEFCEMVSEAFGASHATVMINNWKPLGKRDAKLTEYGIGDGSRVEVNLGGSGGVSINALPSTQKKNVKKDPKWKACATTLEGESKQVFGSGKRFPTDPLLKTTLTLRLVVREEGKPLASSGKCTPLTKATLIPPPVPA